MRRDGKLSDGFEQCTPPRRHATEKRSERGRRIALAQCPIVHAGEPREFRLEMPHRFLRRIVRVEESQRALQQVIQLRGRILRLGREFYPLDEAGGGLRACKIFSDSAERISQNRFGQGVEIRSAAALHLDLHLKEEVELSRENAPRPARPFCDRFDAP